MGCGEAGYEGAVDALDGRAVIDRSRVAIQGWSRTGPYVGYMLTHSKYKFRAAALTDTSDFGWWYYVSQSGQSGASEYGVPPFGEGLATWAELAPSFNLDRVQTPMFMWEAGSPVGQWDWYAVLNHLKSPLSSGFCRMGRMFHSK